MAVERVVCRLGASFPTETVKVAILSAYQTLGYDRPTEDQKRAVTEFVYGRDELISRFAHGQWQVSWLPLVFEYLRQLSNCGTRQENCVVLVLGEAAGYQL